MSVSRKSVASKLYIRPGNSVHAINAPDDYSDLVGQLPAGAQIVEKAEPAADQVHLFAGSKAELDVLLPSAQAATKPGGMLWVAYPKKKARPSDISRQVVHNELNLSNWKPVAQIEVDEFWSAIRARPMTDDERRQKGRA